MKQRPCSPATDRQLRSSRFNILNLLSKSSSFSLQSHHASSTALANTDLHCQSNADKVCNIIILKKTSIFTVAMLKFSDWHLTSLFLLWQLTSTQRHANAWLHLSLCFSVITMGTWFPTDLPEKTVGECWTNVIYRQKCPSWCPVNSVKHEATA